MHSNKKQKGEMMKKISLFDFLLKDGKWNQKIYAEKFVYKNNEKFEIDTFQDLKFWKSIESLLMGRIAKYDDFSWLGDSNENTILSKMRADAQKLLDEIVKNQQFINKCPVKIDTINAFFNNIIDKSIIDCKRCFIRFNLITN